MFESGLVYRPYIDGLRAVAVLLVVFFHMNPGLMPGGYLGVDIFFVISGFVITQSLVKEWFRNNGKIRIVDFYVRRFRRLYPALLTMVLATTAMYVFFGFQWDTNLYLKSALSSVFAVSNLYFLFHGANYFHQDLINPLLHTWSLGIEEQFYLVYPVGLALLLVYAARRGWGMRSLGFTIGALSILSYAGFLFGAGTIFSEYYFPLARFWELGIGCALFFFSYHHRSWVPGSTIFSIGLIAVLGIPLVQPLVANVYAGTLLVDMAAALVILGGLGGRVFARRVLELSPVVYVGEISYSLYLWHLPVIYLANLYLSGAAFYLSAIVGSVALAMISYHCIENPLRHSERFGKGILRLFKSVPYVAGIGAIVVVLGFGFYGQEIRKTINEGFNTLAGTLSTFNYIESHFHLGARMKADYLLRGQDVSGCTFPDPSVGGATTIREACLVGTGSNTVVFLSGDSHASDLIPAAGALESGPDIYFERFPRMYIADSTVSNESRIAAFTARAQLVDILLGKYPHVVHVVSWFLDQPQYEPDDIARWLGEYVAALDSRVEIVLVAPMPVFASGPSSCVILGKHCSVDKVLSQQRRAATLAVLEKIAAMHVNVRIYDPYEFLCPGSQCFMYDSQTDFLRYLDDDHLSIEGSTALSADLEHWMQSEGLLR